MSDVIHSIGKTFYESRPRDAVHMALMAVEVGEPLPPGARVILRDGRAVLATRRETPVGIIDPFLGEERAQPGKWVWLFLWPGTISGLRHEWRHPAIDGATDKEAARAWVEEFAREALGLSYDRLMDAAYSTLILDEPVMDNTEVYKRVAEQKWEVFWKHYATITGEGGKRAHGAPFTCSC